MKICISQLTRMAAPRICIAGIAIDPPRHIRPITGREHSLSRDQLVENGGAFEIGRVMDLGEVTASPSPPETEDHWFSPDRASCIGRLPPDDYLTLLDEVTVDDLSLVFGPALHRRGWKYAVDAHQGNTSLGCLRVSRRPELEVSKFGGLQIRLNDVSPQTYIPVTDLRFFGSDHKTLRVEAIAKVQARLRRDVPLRLMLGLARAFVARGDDTERHWLQVNGLCLDDDPYGP